MSCLSKSLKSLQLLLFAFFFLFVIYFSHTYV